MLGEPQANFLWAYATLGEPVSKDCLASLAARAQSQLPHFTEQGLSNTAWALATMGVRQRVATSVLAWQSCVCVLGCCAPGVDKHCLCSTSIVFTRSNPPLSKNSMLIITMHT